MRFGAALCFASVLICNNVHAQTLPGIDRPVAEVRQRLSNLLQCDFGAGYMDITYACGSRLRAIRATLSKSAGADTFDTVELDVLLARESGKPNARERELAQTTVDILDYVAPAWPDSRRWLASAIEAADTNEACSYMKINGVVISIRPYHYADRYGTYADIYVTRHFDIYSLCEY